MNKNEADKWLEQQLLKLSPNNYVRTYFSVAMLIREDESDRIRIIVPIDVYENGNWGYEIISIQSLAAQCPWDMTKTWVRIHSECTDYEGNLHDLIMESPAAHKKLSALEQRKEGK